MQQVADYWFGMNYPDDKNYVVLMYNNAPDEFHGFETDVCVVSHRAEWRNVEQLISNNDGKRFESHFHDNNWSRGNDGKKDADAFDALNGIYDRLSSMQNTDLISRQVSKNFMWSREYFKDVRFGSVLLKSTLKPDNESEVPVLYKVELANIESAIREYAYPSGTQERINGLNDAYSLQQNRKGTLEKVATKIRYKKK